MKGIKVIYALFLAVLTIVVTIFGKYIGKELYMKNIKDVAVELADVDVVDLISNIRYGLDMGKTLDSFYDLEDTLREEVRRHDAINDIYVMDGDLNILYSTTSDDIPGDLSLLEYGIIEDGNVFYSAHAIDDESVLVTSSDRSLITSLVGDGNSSIDRISLMGCAVTLVIVIAVTFLIRDKKKSMNAGIVVLCIWILVLGVFCCEMNYQGYTRSTARIEESIRTSFGRDIDMLTDKGIELSYIGDLDGYLSRYTENIDSIDSIKVGKGMQLQFITAHPLMNSMTFKYLLQTLMMVFFLYITMVELRIFLEENESDYIRNRSEQTEE